MLTLAKENNGFGCLKSINGDKYPTSAHNQSVDSGQHCLRWFYNFFQHVEHQQLVFVTPNVHSTCDGLGVPAVGCCQVCGKLAALALAHILFLVREVLVRLRVRVGIQVWGRGGQLGSPLTGGEKQGP